MATQYVNIINEVVCRDDKLCGLEDEIGGFYNFPYQNIIQHLHVYKVTYRETIYPLKQPTIYYEPIVQPKNTFVNRKFTLSISYSNMPHVSKHNYSNFFNIRRLNCFSNEIINFKEKKTLKLFYITNKTVSGEKL